jgi:hypothetical protein
VSDFKDINFGPNLLLTVTAQAERLAGVNDGLERGYADLGWLLLEISEMQYWRVHHDTFRDYLKSVSENSKLTVSQLQRYMLTVRDLSETFSRAQLEQMGITKAMKLRTAIEYAIVLPRPVIDAALNPDVTVADLKKVISQTLKMPYSEEPVDWMDCEMEFPVNPEERATIEDGINAAMHCDPVTKSTISKPMQMKDVMLKLCMEFLGAHPCE